MTRPNEHITCREASSLLPLFFDGELEARQMRAVALHGTRCSECEAELRSLERLQELVGDTIAARLEEIDFSGFWRDVESRLPVSRASGWHRLSTWWADRDSNPSWRWPALVAAAAAAVLALFLLTRFRTPNAQPDAPQLASADNPASIDSLDADGSVTVVNDPETRTTILWVSDDTVVGDVP